MPKPLAIIYSDLHLNNWPSFNKNNIRLTNGLKAMLDIRKKSIKLEVPIIFLGDIFHKHETVSNEFMSQVLPELRAIIDNNPHKTYAISGNHDQAEQNFIGDASVSYIDTLSRLFDNFVSVDFNTFIIGDYYFHGIPYLTNDVGLLEEIKNIGFRFKDKKNILLLHTTLPTARDTDGREIHSNLEQNEFLKATKNFKLILSGHIHKPEEIIKKFMYSIGAPQQQRATDRDCDMGYWILFDNLKMRFKKLNYPKFVYYSDDTDRKDDGNFWIKQLQKRKKTVTTDINLKSSDISQKNVKTISNRYCKSKNIKDKRKVSALRKTLTNAL